MIYHLNKLTMHHGAVLRVTNYPDLSIELLRLAVRTSDVFGQLPQGAFLLQLVSREVERS